MIYCDYAATTPVDPRVADVLNRYLTKDGLFGNPSSVSHAFGRAARQAVEVARAQVAQLISASPEEILWTSGATESNNLALLGSARFYTRRGKHIVTVKTEHKSVLDVCSLLEREGFSVTYLDVDQDGLIDINTLQASLRDDTVLVSVMLVNNETGVIQDVEAIGKITRERGIFFHVDGAQAIGKIPVDVKAMHIDLLSMSAHKVYGPKGVGALYVSRSPKIRLQPLQVGGGQERGLRSGTLPTHQIAAQGEAFAIAERDMAKDHKHLQVLRDTLFKGLMSIGEVYANGSQIGCVPGILNVSFNFVDSEALLTALTDIAVSSGSACATESMEPSYVLKAMGAKEVLSRSAIRFSIGRFTTMDEIVYIIQHVSDAVKWLRALK